jgi:predicted nucleotidyltransferase component of viral defense system
LEIVSLLQKEILNLFGKTPDSGNFYLTGGTALAYFYLKHRRSNDLDFFTGVEGLVEPFSRHLENRLEAQGMSVARQRGVQSFIEFQVARKNQSTIIQLAQDAAFRFEPPKTFSEFPDLRVDPLRDIASNKLLALFGRAALRDFIDVHFLIERGNFTQSGLVNDAKQKDPGFDPYWLGVAFERIKTFEKNSPEMLMLSEPLSFPQLAAWFDEWRKKIAGKLRA